MTAAVRLAHTLLRATDPLLENSILFCHGLFGSKQNWTSLSRALYESRCGSVCTVDLRNHGHSPRSPDMSLIAMGYDIIKVVKDLKLHNVCSIGHSLGGKAVMCAALLEPDTFSRMIVLDISPARTYEAPVIAHCLKLMLNADFHRARRETDGSLGGVRQWLSTYWKDQISDDRIRSFLLTNLDQSGSDLVWRVNLSAIESCWHAIMGFPTIELQGRTFTKPTLFVAGGRSDHLRLSDFHEITRFFPSSRLVCVRNAGHWVHADEPHIVQRLVSQFVKCPTDGLLVDGVDDLTEQAHNCVTT